MKPRDNSDSVQQSPAEAQDFSRISRVVPIGQTEEATLTETQSVMIPTSIHALPTPVPPAPLLPVRERLLVPPSRRNRKPAPDDLAALPTASADHEAFPLRRAPGQSKSSGLILPPPPEPGSRELEPATTTTAVRPSAAATQRPPSSRASVRKPSKAVKRTPRFDELPSVDPFEAFRVARVRRGPPWLFMLVVAFAVVGVFAFAAVALGFLGKTGW